MCKILSVSNQKGGVGKTTTTGMLAIGLKARGYRVLAIDLDPQGNLSFSMGADTETSATIYDVLKGELKTQFAIQKTELIDIIAANILLSSIELEFTDTDREFLLKNALQPLLPLYDYIFIDTPPALGILTVNAFAVSDGVIVPMLSDIFSLQGITQLYETVERVKNRCNPSIAILGILLTKHNPRTLFSGEVRGTVEMIAKDLDIPVFDTFIRASVAVSEAQSLQRSMLKYAPKNNVTLDYTSLIDELVAKGV